MSHHKRGRPKHQRAGCLFCKGWKDEREGKNTRDSRRPSERRVGEWTFVEDQPAEIEVTLSTK